MVFIKDGKLVAVVKEYDTKTKEYKCIAAELMAVDLCRNIYERRVSEAMNDRKIHK